MEVPVGVCDALQEIVSTHRGMARHRECAATGAPVSHTGDSGRGHRAPQHKHNLANIARGTDDSGGAHAHRLYQAQVAAEYLHAYQYLAAERFLHKTAEVAQEIFENKELRALFDVQRDMDPDDLKALHNMALALKRKERGNYDDTGC